ncbi:ABC transporter permease [Mediterraneibacter hominis]|uniref:ABC transporter permease n=1 Tax=Mediterraneibacter hominis TaxID=2763054 RepID=UPI001FAE0BF7|nr:ABC transporter permease [Mediterraneibacter hominis]
MKKRQKIKEKIFSLLSIAGFLACWWLITDVFQLANTSLFPSPVTVFETFVDKLTNANPDGNILGVHILNSLLVVGIGYFAGTLLGIPFGIALGWYKKFEMTVRPLFDIIRTIPPIAWIPIFILWLGIGLIAKSAIVFLTVFIAAALNAYTGITSINPVHMWAGQTMGASNWQLLWKIGIPTAVPMICTGLKIGFNTAWTSLVGAELLGATEGLGYMIQMARVYCRADLVIVGMLTIGVIGLVLSIILDYLEIILTKGRY